MKRILLLMMILLLVACGGEGKKPIEESENLDAKVVDEGENNDEEEEITLKIGVVTHTLNAEVIRLSKDLVKNIEIEMVEYESPEECHKALMNGDIALSFAETLGGFNSRSEKDLANIGGIYQMSYGMYASYLNEKEGLYEGATVYLSNQREKQAYSLLLLEDNGVISLNDKALPEVIDITENNLNLNFAEVSQGNWAEAMANQGFFVADKAEWLLQGLDAEGALYDYYPNDAVELLVLKSDLENDERVLEMYKAMRSDEVKKFLGEHYPFVKFVEE